MPVCLREELTELLSRQITALHQLNVPDHDIREAGKLLDLLPEVVDVPITGSLIIPVLLVLPFRVMTFEDQIRSVKYRPQDLKGEAERGYSFLDPEMIYDSRGPSRKPYLLVNVDDGSTTRGMNPISAELLIKKVGRKPLIVAEGLALGRWHPEVFHRHNIYLAGSRIKDKQGRNDIPDLWVYGGRIKMKRDNGMDADPRWGTPSFETEILL